jgi:Family of unknown function (DUF6636)
VSAPRRAAVWVACAGVVLVAGVGHPSAAADGIRGFQSPSRNIVFAGYTGAQPASLRCDITSGLRPRPSRPKGCEFDYGGSLGLGAHGKGRVLCVSEAPLADPTKAPVLAYGRSWRDGPFTCTSRRTGVTCRNLDGHGLFLSRAHSYLF